MYKKIVPSHYVKSILDIDYDSLYKQGIRALFFDLDNTIIPYDVNIVPDEFKVFLESLLDRFKIVVTSNSKKKRVSKAVSNLGGIPYVSFSTKPLKFGFKRAMKLVGAKREEVAVIGDQLMTDILGANRMKFRVAIFVYPVKKRSDHFLTRTNRKLEMIFIRKIKRKMPEKYEEVLKEYAESK